MTVEQWAPWVIGAMGVVCFYGGILAYQGRYKSWLVLKSVFPGWIGLASLYLGVAMVMLALAPFLKAIDAPGIVAVLWLLVTAPSMIIGIIGCFWLPRFMWPQWMKETQREIDRGEDALSQALRPGGALYGRLGRPRGTVPPRMYDGTHHQTHHEGEHRP
jgi:hypothetical protein